MSERLCECGCGECPPLAKRSRPYLGHVKGQPLRCVPGHQARLTRRKGPDYTEEDRAYETPCWIWRHGLTAGGYAHCGSREHPSRYAHRWYYERFVGPIPAGVELDHLCRNRDCVNPAHLEPVAHAVNARRGAQTKLAPEDVVAIRASALSDRLLATLYGLSHGHVNAIRVGRKWRTLDV